MAKILVIGGGVAGLSAGIHALQNGHEVTICERHKVAGGNLTGWWRGEYYIDNCIHWLTGTNVHTDRYKLWRNLGALGGVPIYQAETLYTCELDGEKLSLNKDLGRLRWDMLSISPQDGREIEALIAAVESMQGLFGTAGVENNESSTLWQKIIAVPALFRYCLMSTGDLSKKFIHPLLGQFICCFIGKDFSALALLVVFATFCGGDGGIPMGGSLKMAERMADKFQSLGGALLLGKRAKRVNLYKGKAVSVSFFDGEQLSCDYVVCATDAKTAFCDLLDRPLPRRLQKAYNDPKTYRFSSYHTAFACQTDELLFKGDYIFSLPKKDQALLGTRYFVLREFTHDKSFAPKGHTVLQTLTFCKEEKSKQFIQLRKDKESYMAKKKQIAEAMERIIVEKFPTLQGKIHCLDVWTPATYQRYYGEEAGAYMSCILPKGKLPHCMPSRVKGVKNVLLATQWQQFPGGLPTAAQMGKNAAVEIERLEDRVAFAWKWKISRVRRSKKIVQ